MVSSPTSGHVICCVFTCIIASISLEKKTLLFTRQPLIWSC
uniref:Uncharacterized protein n=1 Tax=Anguilla anguilla TaxID=7936 RepID=A0A0E9SP08_ANGAN